MALATACRRCAKTALLWVAISARWPLAAAAADVAVLGVCGWAAASCTYTVGIHVAAQNPPPIARDEVQRRVHIESRDLP